MLFCLGAAGASASGAGRRAGSRIRDAGARMLGRFRHFCVRPAGCAHQGGFARGGGFIRWPSAGGGGGGGLRDDDGGAVAAGEGGGIGVVDAGAGFRCGCEGADGVGRGSVAWGCRDEGGSWSGGSVEREVDGGGYG